MKTALYDTRLVMAIEAIKNNQKLGLGTIYIIFSLQRTIPRTRLAVRPPDASSQI